MSSSQLNSQHAARPFVGRAAYLRGLDSSLSRAMRGNAQLELISGEAGIGKSTLTQRFADQVRGENSATVVAVRCHSFTAAPYAPWRQALRSLSQQLGAERFGILAAPHVPRVGGWLVESERPVVESSAADPEFEQYLRHEAAVGLLGDLSVNSPLLIIFDDLENADGATLELIGFAIHELLNARVMIVGAFRTDSASAALQGVLPDLRRNPNVHERVLAGLEPTEVAQLLEEMDADSDVAEILGRTGGNPLFVTELARMDAPSGSIPAGIVDVITARLSSLSADAMDTLRAAAVVGESFDPAIVSVVIGSTQDFSAALDEIFRAGVFREAVDDHYAYTHALFRETVLSGMTLPELARTHLAVAEAIEDMHAGRLSGVLRELAEHFHVARSLTGPERCIEYSTLAAQQAIDDYAFGDAQHLIAKALNLIPGDDLTPAKLRLLEMGFACHIATTGNMASYDTYDLAEELFNGFLQLGDTQGARRVAAGLPTGPSGGPDRRPLLDKALELVEPDTPEYCRLLISHASSAGVEGADLKNALAGFERAISLAKDLNDSEFEGEAWFGRGGCLLHHMQMAACVEFLEQAMRLATDTDQPLLFGMAARHACAARLALGDVSGAIEAADSALARISELRFPRVFSEVRLFTCLPSIAIGDHTRALQLLDEALDMTPGDPRLHSFRAIARAQAGNLTGAREDRDVVELAFSSRSEERVMSLISFVRISSAVTLGNEIAAGERESIRRGLATHKNLKLTPLHRSGVLSALSMGAAAAGDREAAGAALVEIAGDPDLTHRWIISSLLLIALLKRTAGDTTYPDALKEAIDHDRDLGFRPSELQGIVELCKSAAEGAVTLPPAETARLRVRARVLATEMSLDFRLQEIDAIERQMDSTQTAGGHPAGLSDREIEVLKLVATGKTNPEIAEALFISRNTVAHHVTSILNKTGATNRSEATAYAMRSGIAT